ncbi:Rdx family protein [Nocardia testacea]|uniref:Rdx family protein n=1 Tax=Nocardia testacea TaxID=248551 RepID=UPI00031BA819|nr:Rdx family protein [Nocardia testacea]
MTITITYCVPCKYDKRAQNAADAIARDLGLTVDLIPGRGGVFDVAVDGVSVAKRTREHFPTTDEIVTAVRGQSMHS